MIWFLSFLLFFSSLSFSLSSSEVSSLLKFIAMRHIHAPDDDHLTYEQALEAIKHRKLRMTCSYIAQFAEKLLNAYDIPCRFILTLTLDEWNDYNNGHSMIEVYQHDRWELWDIDQKHYFVFEGERVDAKTFCKIHYMLYELVKFSKSPILPKEDKNNWLDLLTKTDDFRREWYARVCQIPMIRENGILYYTSDEQDRKRIELYPFSNPIIHLSQREFEEKFY